MPALVPLQYKWWLCGCLVCTICSHVPRIYENQNKVLSISASATSTLWNSVYVTAWGGVLCFCFVSHFTALCVISGFYHEVDKNCTLLGYYTVSSGNSLPMFRNNLSVQYLRVKNPNRKLVTPVHSIYRKGCEWWWVLSSMVLANRVDVGLWWGVGQCSQWVLLGKVVWEREVTAKCRTGREGKTYVWILGEGKKEEK